MNSNIRKSRKMSAKITEILSEGVQNSLILNILMDTEVHISSSKNAVMKRVRVNWMHEMGLIHSSSLLIVPFFNI